jgi:AcrR family transcriptional regulator
MMSGFRRVASPEWAPPFAAIWTATAGGQQQIGASLPLCAPHWVCVGRYGGLVGEKQTRRRGAALESVILEAAWQELSERGWVGFTVEGVAARSGAAKTVIYRRWSNRVALVEDMLNRARADAEVPLGSSGSIRADLLGFLEGMTAFLSTGFGDAARGVLCESSREGQPSIFEDPGIVFSVAAMVDQAVARGELKQIPSPIGVNLGHSLVMFEFLQTGMPPSRAGLVDLVDNVWLPALGAAR